MDEKELQKLMGEIIYKHQGGFTAIDPVPIPIHTRGYCMSIAKELLALFREAGWKPENECMFDIAETEQTGHVCIYSRGMYQKFPRSCLRCGKPEKEAD